MYLKFSKNIVFGTIPYPYVDNSLVEHMIQIKGYKLHRQLPRRFNSQKMQYIKAAQSRIHQYSQVLKWLSKIVSMINRSGKVVVCIDYRNLNLATPKDNKSQYIYFCNNKNILYPTQYKNMMRMQTKIKVVCNQTCISVDQGRVL
jgi:hypothetical protein